MSNVKITDLPSLTGALSDSLDVLPVVDVSGDATSKMTRAEFFLNVPAITTTGNVGIGTTTPLAKVHSQVNTFTTADMVAYKAYNNQGVGVYANFQNSTTGTAITDGFLIGINDNEEAMLINYEATAMAFFTNATECMRIDASGNVGIGTTSPSRALSVASVNNILAVSGSFTLPYVVTGAEPLRIGTFGNTNFAQGTASVGNAVGLSISNFNVDSGGGSTAIQAGVDAGTGGLELQARQTGAGVVSRLAQFHINSSQFFTANTERMRITSTGNVGIGGTVPASNPKLSMYGGIRFLANETAAATYTGIGSIATDTVCVSTSGSERMRIDASGNVGIGNSAPVAKLHVTGASITTGVTYLAQPAQTSKAAAATLTIAELLTGIIQYTGAVATLTLPTGTDIEGGLPATFPTNMSFDVSFINTGAALLTIGANGNTTVGTMTVATLTSAMLRFRKTAANTYTVYRIS